MSEEYYFHKMFVEHLSNGQYFQLLDKDVYEHMNTLPTYVDWITFISPFRLWYGEIKSYHLNTQKSYFKERLDPWEDYYNVFNGSLSGLNYLRILHPKSQYKTNWGVNKTQQISQLCADIIRNPVANPTFYFDHHRRVHPGKNMVSAHQILGRKLKVIVAHKRERNWWNIPVLEKSRIRTLEDLASKYERIPHVFMERGHIHIYCLHKGWTNYDNNGYIQKRRFDLDRFLDIVRDNIDSNDIMLCEKTNGKVVEVPNTTNRGKIQTLFSIVHDAECFLD